SASRDLRQSTDPLLPVAGTRARPSQPNGETPRRPKKTVRSSLSVATESPGRLPPSLSRTFCTLCHRTILYSCSTAFRLNQKSPERRWEPLLKHLHPGQHSSTPSLLLCAQLRHRQKLDLHH